MKKYKYDYKSQRKNKYYNQQTYFMFNSFFAILLIILTIASLVIDGVWVYYKFFGKEKLPQTVDSIYINAYQDEDGEKQARFNINYYDNSKHNGKPMLEFAVEGFTDVEMQATASIGMQTIGDNLVYERLTQQNCTEAFADQYINPYVNYYEIRDGQSYPATSRLTRQYPLLVETGGELYELKLNKMYRYSGTDFIFFKKDYYAYYTWSDLMSKMLDVAKTFPEGTSFQRINLAEYFTVYKYNKETKQFNNVDDSNYFFTECVFKVNKSTSGVTRAKNSIFGMFDYDRNYGENISQDYWQATQVQELTIADFDKRESLMDNGNLLTLNEESREFFKNNPQIKARVVLTLKPQDNIVGLDYMALHDIEISSITIIAYYPQEFIIKADALQNTHFNIELISSSNVTIIGG